MMSVRLPLFLALALTLAAGPAAAQTAAAPPPPPAPPTVKPIPYGTVKSALAALKARDGQDAVVTTSDEGWVVVAEPMTNAQWAFPPAGHPAHPSVVRRTILRAPGTNDVSVDVALLCEAPAAACDALRTEYTSLNDRIIQAAKSRRGRPTPPTPPASN